jgi:hypothetical protein
MVDVKVREGWVVPTVQNGNYHSERRVLHKLKTVGPCWLESMAVS